MCWGTKNYNEAVLTDTRSAGRIGRAKFWSTLTVIVAVRATVALVFAINEAVATRERE